MGLVTIGVKSVKYAPLAGDGGPGTVFTALGFTSKGSLTFNEEAPSKKLVEAEESADPIAIFKRAGARTVTLQLADPDLAALNKIRGGTITTASPNDTYSEDSPVSLVGTLQIEPEQGFTSITYNHVSIDGRFSGGLGADQELLLTLEVDILKPKKAATKVMEIKAPTTGGGT